MKAVRTVYRGVCIATMLFFTLALSSGWAWTYGIDTYDYVGSPALIGTVPGAIYTAKVAVATNDSATADVLTVDLYYGFFSGLYQWSPDEGAHWINIAPGTSTWSRTVQPGDTIWLRAVLTNDNGNTYHILSPSPWGTADSSYGEAYYWAFPPGAHYYDRNWQRDIAGYVAVALE